ncbi:hypothetical protein GOV04_01475 [Candidatus Woesearchaeota archaeon]|nr:hypothetical protein [Candidatus Woesearchaeota archaeon]
MMFQEEPKPAESEENVYSEDHRSDMVDNDEISAEEEAFMKGYDDADDDEDNKEEEKTEENEEE